MPGMHHLGTMGGMVGGYPVLPCSCPATWPSSWLKTPLKQALFSSFLAQNTVKTGPFPSLLAQKHPLGHPPEHPLGHPPGTPPGTPSQGLLQGRWVLLGGSLGAPRGSLGAPRGSLGAPRRSLGAPRGPWVSLEEVPGCPWKRSLGVPGRGPWVSLTVCTEESLTVCTEGP